MVQNRAMAVSRIWSIERRHIGRPRTTLPPISSSHRETTTKCLW